VTTPDDARAALFARLIDHAPMFPPASLSLDDAVAEDERARRSSHAFALGRFVCPASRFPELPDVGRGVSLVLDAEPPVDDRIEAVEVPPSVALEAVGPRPQEVYVEVPLDGAVEDRLEEIAASGARAKVRCGGAAVPEVDELAGLVRACRERGLAFKATAGLHHALAANGEHGLLNLLAAVVFGDEAAALSETDPTAFRVDRDAFRWRDRVAGPSEVAAARAGGLHSVGSCSFFEPLEELESLGVLPR
jgi:hypothetical protein